MKAVYLIILVKILFQITNEYFNQVIDKEEMYIAIVGDFGLNEEKSTIKKNVVKQIKILNKKKVFNLGLILGDNVYEFGSKSGDYQTINNIFAESFPRNEFNINFLTILGNHEYFGVTQTQIEYSKLDTRFYMPSRFYKYDVHINRSNIDVSFVCSDSTPIMEQWLIKSYGIDDRVQKKALENFMNLSQSSDYVFVMNHHNSYASYGPHTEWGNDNYLNGLCNKYKSTAVLAGHNHNMQYTNSSNSHSFIELIVGNSSKKKQVTITKPRNHQGWYYDRSGGFATLLIRKNNAIYKFIDENGNILNEITLNKIN